MIARMAFIGFLGFLAGCGSSLLPAVIKIDRAISKYQAVADQIELGDSIDQVLAILKPTQKGLPKSARKRPEKYIRNGVRVEIHFMRVSRQPDGRTTDDEFVPYLFNDGRLVGIGWLLLGGPTTQGQKTPRTNIVK